MRNRKKGLDLSAVDRKVWIIAGSIIGCLLLIYIGFSIFFMSHFFFRTTLNGMSVSGKTAAAVQQKAEEGIKAYELTITCRDGSEAVIPGNDFSLEEKWDDGIQDLIKKQNGFAWIGKLFSPDKLELEGIIEYDESRLADALAQQSFMQAENQVKAVDATVSEYSETEGYTLVPAVEGTEINEEKLLSVIKESVYALDETVDLAESGCYVEPEVKDDNEKLLAAIDNLNQYLGARITYTVGDETQVLDSSIFQEWLKLSGTLEASVDEEMVAEYVSTLSSKYNTCYSAKKLVTTWGPTVTISNSHYGWKVDKEAEAAAIIADIKAGEAVTRDLNYSMTANSHGENDYGDSYVEINLTAQHLYLYENGEMILETDFVSGDPRVKGNATPPGAYGLTYKQKDATLNGATYSTPVNYWMPFYGNYGMHDATWRSSFGGIIYKTNGSHGCVNLPYSAAEKIFSVVDKNYPVLVYELEGTESEKGKAQEAANAVIKAIKSAVGDEVTLEDEAAITEARQKYDALSEAAKSYVTNYETLTNAEKQLAELKKAQEAETMMQQAEEEMASKKSETTKKAE